MKVIKEIPEELNNRSRFDWDVILDGQLWQMEQGVDFQTDATAFGSTVRSAAARRGIGVKIKVRKSFVFIQSNR